MDRGRASQIMRELMDLHGLKDWSARLNPVPLDSHNQYMGICLYKDKALVLNAHHVDLHEQKDVTNTILHEIAHALCPGQGHNEVWAAKAREIGCFHVAPCSTLGLPEHVIDGIRSGATIEVQMHEEVTVNRTAKYVVTRLQDKCPTCGKVAVIKSEILEGRGEDEPDKKYQFLECGHVEVKWIPKATPFHKIIFDGSPDCKHDWVKTVCGLCGAKKPYDFQVEGMRFAEQALASYKGVVIMDEMGLGKTIQANGYLKYHEENWPVLFIVKSGLKFQFGKEIMRVCGDLKFCQIINSSKDFLIPGLAGYIIGYDMLTPKTRSLKNGGQSKSGFDIRKFWERGIKTVVLDECQQIKNPDSTRTQMVRRIVSGPKPQDVTENPKFDNYPQIKVIGLSGTPWKNRGSEFFTILNMVAPSKFSSYQGFKDRWVSYFVQGNYTKEGGIKRPELFKEYIKDFAIRRQRTEVLSELPLINRMKLHIQLEELQAQAYESEVSDFVKWYNDFIIDGREDEAAGDMNMLAKLSRMRHITGLAKIPATQEYVEQFFEENDRKLVVFAHHVDVQQILYDNAVEKYKDTDVVVLRILGGQDAQSRFEAQEKFNAAPRALMIASTLAAGEGLNLQTCADCVMHERQWNPANEEQAEGRFIRIGQTATSVGATYVEAEDTIDSLFDEIVERKRHQFHEAMNKGEAPQWNSSDMLKELAQAIVTRWNKKNKGTTLISKNLVKA